MNDNFEIEKRKALKRLAEHLACKRVDEEIIPFLKFLNSLPNFFTTSSCSGRIIVYQVPVFHDKEHCEIIGKWHREIQVEEVKEIIAEKYTHGELWIKQEPFIFHIVCKSIEDARKLQQAVKNIGIREAYIFSFSRKIVLQITSSEKLEAPLGIDGKVIVSDDYLKHLVDIANRKLKRSYQRLKMLEDGLKKYFGYFGKNKN